MDIETSQATDPATTPETEPATETPGVTLADEAQPAVTPIDPSDDAALLEAAVRVAMGDSPAAEANPEAPPVETAEKPEAPVEEPKKVEVELDEAALVRARELDEARQLRDEISASRAELRREKEEWKAQVAAARKDPLALLAKTMGLDNPYAAYEALSHQVAKGAPPKEDPMAALQRELASQKKQFEAYKSERSGAAQAAEEREVSVGILDMIESGEYPLVKAMGSEKVRDAVFQEIVAEFKKTGNAPFAGDLIGRYEAQIRADWLSLSENKALLEAAKLRPHEATSSPSDTGTEPAPKPAMTTLTNTLAGAEARPEVDEDYWKDEQKLLAMAVAAVKGG